MSDADTTLYPSNWLYNAGIIGLVRVLEAGHRDVSGLLSDDGTIDGDQIIGWVKSVINDKGEASELRYPLSELPAWHWRYAKLSFEWNYGSVQAFVNGTLTKVQRASNKAQLRKQLECKGFDYQGRAVDFEHVNTQINELFNRTFGRDATLTTGEATDGIVTAILRMEHAYIFRKAIGYLFPKGGFYQNLFNPGWFSNLGKFIDFCDEKQVFRPSSSNSRCPFCAGKQFETAPIDATSMSFLFPVFSKFPNAYWQGNEEAVTKICSFCKFILLHHHLALTRLSDGSEIFINAPSFKLMYHLNKFTGAVFGAPSAAEARGKREILAMSVIEYATRIRTTLGAWAATNIEVVSRRGEQIEFFDLPYDAAQLLSDREIAAVLRDLGELSLLNLVLRREYSQLVELGYRLLRKAISELNRNDWNFVNYWLTLDKNRHSLKHTAERILKLYALIEQNHNRSELYGTRNIARSEH